MSARRRAQLCSRDGARKRKTRSLAHLICAIAAWTASAWTASAEAYVRSRDDKTFSPFFWTDPRQALEVARPPDGLGISAADLRATAEAAIASWSYPKLPCTGVSLRLGQDVTDSQVAGRDRTNRIIMRVGAWCRDPIRLYKCHDEAAVALTTVFTIHNPGWPDDGEIVEADIEVNAVGNYLWAVIPEGPISGRDFANVYDLTSVLTHEIGHFIGLDHNCQLPNTGLLIDDDGVARVDCFSPPPSIQTSIEDATMYPFMATADLKLRTLTADDARGACEIYPPSSVPVDEWIGAGGCAASPTPVSRGCFGMLVATALMAIAAILFRAPRWRRGAPTRFIS